VKIQAVEAFLESNIQMRHGETPVWKTDVLRGKGNQDQEIKS